MDNKAFKITIGCPYCHARQWPSFHVNLSGVYFDEKMICANPHCKEEFYIFQITYASKTMEELKIRREEAVNMLKAITELEQAKGKDQIQ